MSLQRQTDFSWQRRVLVADSSVAVLGTFRAAFEHQEPPVSIRTTPSSVYAFEIALKEDFDLFVFSQSMPSIDGGLLYELLGKVYENSRPLPRRLPPLLLITINPASRAARMVLSEPGVLGALSIPSDPGELRARMLPHLTRER